MSLRLQFFLILGISVYLVIIFHLLIKKQLNLKYTLIWLLSAFVMLIITIFPQLVAFFAKFTGIETPVNLVYVVEGMFVLFILLSMTTIVSRLNNRIYELTQSQAILERRIRDLEKSSVTSEHD